MNLYSNLLGIRVLILKSVAILTTLSQLHYCAVTSKNFFNEVNNYYGIVTHNCICYFV